VLPSEWDKKEKPRPSSRTTARGGGKTATKEGNPISRTNQRQGRQGSYEKGGVGRHYTFCREGLPRIVPENGWAVGTSKERNAARAKEGVHDLGTANRKGRKCFFPRREEEIEETREKDGAHGRRRDHWQKKKQTKNNRRRETFNKDWKSLIGNVLIHRERGKYAS